MPKKNAPETVTFAFRLSKEDREWLETTASANGVEVSQLVRWALETLQQYVQLHGGRLHLPINIQEMWTLAQQQQSYPRAAEDPAAYTVRKRPSQGA